MSNRKFISIIAICLVLLIFSVNIVKSVPAYSTNIDYVSKLFSNDRVVNIDIVIDEAAWEDLKQNPLDKTIYNTTIIIDGETISNVGFRTKGDSTLNNLSNDSTTDRYSFKLDFNYYDSTKNYYGLTKLNLNNAYQDNSYMKNNLSYKLFKLMNVPYCEASYAYITINGTEFGLYETIEGVEESYLIRNFGEQNSSGDLYKPDGVGSDLKWLGNDYSLYTGMNLKTNKGSTDNSALIKFLDTINNGDSTDLENYLNVDEALRYFAVNTALANMDSYQGNMKHNYYLYEINGVFQILPWDYNLAFGGFGRANISIDNPTNGQLEDRPLLNILLSNEEYKAKYYEYLTQVVNIFTDGALKSMIEEVTNLIEPYVQKDPTKFCTMDEFYQAVDTTGNTSAQTDNLNLKDELNSIDSPPDNQNLADNSNLPNNQFQPNGNFKSRGGMGNTGNLLETAQKLATSILNQISGEEVIEVNISNDKRMNNFQNIEPPKNRQNIEQTNKRQNIQVPENRDNMDNRFNGDVNSFRGKDFNRNGTDTKQLASKTIIIVIISFILILISIIAVLLFNKKRYKLQQ